MNSGFITNTAFGIVALLCAAALYSRVFHDNWLQSIGFVAMGITSASAAVRLWQMEWVPTEMLFFAVGACSYGFGTAIKVWEHRHDNARRVKPKRRYDAVQTISKPR